MALSTHINYSTIQLIFVLAIMVFSVLLMPDIVTQYKIALILLNTHILVSSWMLS